MKRLTRTLALTLSLSALTLAATSCGDEESASAPTDSMVDVRVEIPVAQDGYIDLISPEFVIEPAQERMYCIHMRNDAGDVAVSEMETMQGNFGHHVVLLSTVDPREPGTVEDCTDASEMWKYRSFILPSTPLADGQGIRIPAGMPYVLQIHYVNASRNSILIRDIARLRQIPPEDVTTWVSTVTTNSLRLEVLETGVSQESFDCVLENDVDLLVLGGHMHENGTRMEILVGPDADNLQSMYTVDPWKPDFRDFPPVTYLFNEPAHLPAGTLIRTSCTWENQTGAAMTFPAEMCSGFGYIAGQETPVHCVAE